MLNLIGEQVQLNAKNNVVLNVAQTVKGLTQADDWELFTPAV